MTNEDLSIALYEKMCAEQETYRAWLLSQPPEEILNHACYVYFKPSRRRPCLLFPLSGKYGKQRASKVFKASNFVDALKRY